MRSILVFAMLAVSGMAAPAIAQNLPVGVYDCYGPSMAEGGANPGRFGETYDTGVRASRQNVSGGKFSVIGPNQYMSRGGGTGRFSFDGQTLSMIDGPYAGLRYHKYTERFTMRMLRPGTDVEGPIVCPVNAAKDPRHPNAW